jgi:uncharacterized protein (TIGR02001 family)
VSARHDWYRAAVLLACLLGPAGAGAEVGADMFSATVTLTTDYVHRGISQSNGDPAVQGGFNLENEAGFLAGVWASSVQFPAAAHPDNPRDLELDYYLGYRLDLGRDWGGDVTFTRYGYPGADALFDYDYNELRVSIGYQDLLAGAVAYADEAFGYEGDGVAYELLGRWPIGERFETVLGAGYFDLQEVFGDSYFYWNVDLSRIVGRFVLTVSYIDTGSSGERLWTADLAAARVVVSLSASI